MKRITITLNEEQADWMWLLVKDGCVSIGSMDEDYQDARMKAALAYGLKLKARLEAK